MDTDPQPSPDSQPSPDTNVDAFPGSAPDQIAAVATLAALRGITAPTVKFGTASDMVTHDGYVLHSDHLGTKWGFGDGDCPDFVLDMADDWFNDDTLAIGNAVWHPILFHLVTTRLLPAIGAPDAPVYLMSTHHNPIRLTDPTYTPPAGSVTVPWIDLLSLVLAAMPDQPILSDADRDARDNGW